MVSQEELIKRRSFYFRRTPLFQLHKGVTITPHDPSEKSTETIVGWLVSGEGGFKHAFVSCPSIKFNFASLLKAGFPMQALKEIIDGIAVTWGNANPLMDDRGELNAAPFTGRVFIFTGTLHQSRDEIKETFRAHSLEAVIIDEERWKAEWDATPADVFICHDSRDKPRFARPLYEELTKRNFKIWLDEYSIKPGNDVVAKIDHGLATSRHALILLTKRFLKNDRWASQEMSALLARQFGTKRNDLIIPLYIGVSWADVQARSPLLAKVAPVKAGAMHFQKRLKNVVDEICRTVRPGQD
jgi:hypothetical protein